MNFSENLYIFCILLIVLLYYGIGVYIYSLLDLSIVIFLI